MLQTEADGIAKNGLQLTLSLLAGLLLVSGNGHAQQDAERASQEPPADASTGDAAVPADLLQRAFEAIRAQRPQEAYDLLAPYETQLAGDPAYDYVYGMAALDAGRASEAVFVLQRVVATSPDYSGARMELARAYYEAGDNERARVQFERLHQESPPPAAEQAISNYLAAIDQRASAYRTRWTPYVGLSGGYDSNANASTDEQVFLGFTLSEINVEESSSFVDGLVGGNLAKPLSANNSLVANVEVGHRHYPDASFVDTTVGRGFIGFNHEFGPNVFKAAVGGYVSYLDGEDNESGTSLDLELSRTLNDSWVITGVLRGGIVRFANDIDIMDVDRVLGAFRLLRRATGPRQGIFSVSLIGGQDSETESGSPYGNTKWGARVGGSWSPSGRSRMFVDVGALTTDYDGQFFGMDRQDDQFNASIGLRWQRHPGRSWIINPYVRFVTNDSDVDLYEYDRVEAGLTLKREF